MQFAGEVPRHEVVGGVCHAYEVWCGECGEYRDCHHYGVDGGVEYAELHTQRGYDESEFADLCK